MNLHLEAQKRDNEVVLNSPLRILFLEDEPKDAELVKASLEIDGIVCELTRADTRAGFRAYLLQGGFDLILADYTLPLFDGISALKIAQEISPEIPFIFVSGTLGEELAIDALKLGATDYVFKTRLSRITPSVRRALREANEREQRRQAEKALERNEAYLAEAQRLSNTGSFGWNVANESFYWSDETYRIFAFELPVQPTLDLAMERVHPDDRRLVRRVFNSAAQKEEHFDFEHRLLMPDGSVKHVRVVGHPSAFGGSADFEFVGAVTDITERKRAEQALRQSEAYLAEAQRLSQTGSWAWNRATGDMRYWSEECYRVLGFDPQGSLPRFEAFFQRIHPDDQAAIREKALRVIRERADFESSFRYVHPERGIRVMHAVGHAVVGAEGNLVEFVGTMIDITERKRAEEELRQLADLVPQVIVVLDSNGKLIHVNRVAREYTGLTLDQYLSADLIRTAIHPDDAKRMRAERTHGFSKNAPFELEARLRGKDGVYRWFLFRYNPLVEEDRVRRWYASATEIESRKQEEERVRKENVLLEERTRIAQELHDTLLQSFLSASMQLTVALDELPADSLPKPRLDRILQIMNQGIAEGRNTIQQLRSSDSHTLDLVMALSRVPRELAIQPDIDFCVSVAGRQRPLQCSVRHEIYRIGREALINAFCHSRATRVEFELEYADSDLRLRIRDNGCGIGPIVLRDGRDGHFGLAGMRERAARIGGELIISSAEAAGTEVRLSIPNSIALQLSPSDHGSEQ